LIIKRILLCMMNWKTGACVPLDGSTTSQRLTRTPVSILSVTALAIGRFPALVSRGSL
jgi:hypothetical protein